jgi:hypothetical protein
MFTNRGKNRIVSRRHCLANAGQRQERQAMALGQRIEIKEIERQVKTLDSIDTRELASLARDERRNRFVLARGPEGVMPSLMELLKRGSEPSNDGPGDVQAEFGKAVRGKKSRLPDIECDFERASRDADGQNRVRGGKSA